MPHVAQFELCPRGLYTEGVDVEQKGIMLGMPGVDNVMVLLTARAIVLH